LTRKHIELKLFAMANNMNKESLLAITAERLEEGEIPPLQECDPGGRAID